MHFSVLASQMLPEFLHGSNNLHSLPRAANGKFRDAGNRSKAAQQVGQRLATQMTAVHGPSPNHEPWVLVSGLLNKPLSVKTLSNSKD